MTSAADQADPSAPTVPRKRRRWYVAAILSLVCVGLGQLYNGQTRWAASLFALSLGLSGTIVALMNAAATSFRAWAFALSVLTITLLVKLCTAIGAGFSAWRIGAIEPKRYNRAWVYGAIMIIAASLEVAIPRYLGKWQAYNIPSGSNLPTLIIGDHLMSEPGYYRHHDPQRGEMAVFKLPTDSRTDYIKRIVGLPGETIQMIGGRLHINGVVVARERIADDIERRGATEVRFAQYIETLPGGFRYRIREERGGGGMLGNTPTYVVPDGHYFVLGDNRDNSLDSRVLSQFGYIPRANFRDRPNYIFWSLDMSRLGRPVEQPQTKTPDARPGVS
jgi:signal peptidase I